MNRVTKQKLEDVRSRTPRYLFRLWSNCKDEGPSGGYKNLNTTTAITPLAFFRGKGHASAYHMTKDEFTSLAKCHLNTCQHIETEFSSWSASLSFVLNKCPGVGTGGQKLADRDHGRMYICIIDTKMLWDTNQAFHAPLLDSMSSGDFNYPHEYLVHGVIEGPGYKAIPYSVLMSSPDFSFSTYWYFNDEKVPVKLLTKNVVEMARTAGEMFGGVFTLPIMLAVLSCQRRDEDLWIHGVDGAALKKVLAGLPGNCDIPKGWKKDKTITKRHFISSRNYSDTKQMTRLMRALVDHSRGKKHVPEDESGDEESVCGDEAEEEPEEGEEAAEDPPEGPAEEDPDEADEAMFDAEADQQAPVRTKDEQVVDAVDAVSEAGKRRGVKSRLRPSKEEGVTVKQKVAAIEKESEATSAAKAIWRRRYSKGSMRLQTALS